MGEDVLKEERVLSSWGFEGNRNPCTPPLILSLMGNYTTLRVSCGEREKWAVAPCNKVDEQAKNQSPRVGKRPLLYS